jgi:hypothetical protein
MTAQDVINLELLQRATDSRVPLQERQGLQETLAYALLEDNSGGRSFLDALTSLEGQPVPEEMILWVLDWLDSQPIQRRPEDTTFMLARLWQSASGELSRTRLLDVINVLSSESGEPLERSAIWHVVEQELKNAVHEETNAGLVAAVDLALTQRDSRLLSAIARVLQSSHEFQRLETAVYGRLISRLPALSTEMQAAVIREFPGFRNG